MSRQGRYVIDRMKIWATKWNLKMPVPPYDDVNYWEGVYRTTQMDTDPSFEWGNLSCSDLLTHTYEPIPIASTTTENLPSFSSITLPQSMMASAKLQQTHSPSHPANLSKPVQVRRKNQSTSNKGANSSSSTTRLPYRHDNSNSNSNSNSNKSSSTKSQEVKTMSLSSSNNNNNNKEMRSETHTESNTSDGSTGSRNNNANSNNNNDSITTTTTTTLGELLGNVHPNNTENESILILGCGTSQFGEDMIKHQWMGPIIQLDCSSRLIESITKRYHTEYISTGKMIAIQDDATVLSALNDNTIHAVFDKGLMDAFFCTDNDTYLTDTLSSVHRVLRPNGGTFCTLSLSHPQFVLPKLLPPLYNNMGRTTDATVSSLQHQLQPIMNTPSRFMLQQRQHQINRLWSHIEVRLIRDYMYCYRFTKK